MFTYKWNNDCLNWTLLALIQWYFFMWWLREYRVVLENSWRGGGERERMGSDRRGMEEKPGEGDVWRDSEKQI